MHGAAARHAQGLRSALEAAKPGASPQEAPPVDPAAKRGLAGWLAEHRAKLANRLIRSPLEPLLHGVMIFLIVTNPGAPRGFIYFQF